jgi:hypothetical protein
MQSATEKISLRFIRTLRYTKPYMNLNFSKYLRQHLVIRETVTGNWTFVRMTLFTCHRNLERRRPISGVNKVHWPVRFVPQSISNRPTTTYRYCNKCSRTGCVLCNPTIYNRSQRKWRSKRKFRSSLAHWQKLKPRKISTVSNVQEMITLHYILLY